MAFNSVNKIFSFGYSAAGCLIFFLLFACCASTLFVFTNKPPAVWNNISTFLNNGLEYPSYELIDPSKVEESIITQIKNVGDNDVYITDQELNSLINTRFPQFRDIVLKTKTNSLNMYWKLDNSENPIYGEAVVQIYEDNQLVITQLGTHRIYFPNIFYPAINNLVRQLLTQDFFKDKLQTLEIDNNLEIREVRFLEGRTYIKVNVNVKIF